MEDPHKRLRLILAISMAQLEIVDNFTLARCAEVETSVVNYLVLRVGQRPTRAEADKVVAVFNYRGAVAQKISDLLDVVVGPKPLCIRDHLPSSRARV